jgi:hypothetical protein
LVLLGSFFLASNLGLIDVSLMQIVKVWWPGILIALGLAMFINPKTGTPDKQAQRDKAP